MSNNLLYNNKYLPQEDFYRYVNSKWMSENKIPNNKAKSFVISITEKLTAKEKSYNSLNTYGLLDEALEKNVVPVMKLIDLILN